MSRTTIRKMETKESVLLKGNNADSNNIFLNDGVGFIQSFSKSNLHNGDSFPGELLSADCDISEWLNNTNPCISNLNSNLNDNGFFCANELQSLYSFHDDILDNIGDAVSLNPLETDSVDLEIEGFLSEASRPDVSKPIGLSYDFINSDIPKCLADNDIFSGCNVLGSPDSGFSSSDEKTSQPNSDSFLDFLSDNMLDDNLSIENNNIFDSSINNENQLNDLITSDLISNFPLANVSKPLNEEPITEQNKSNKRYQPYKRKAKTEEQKVRKKSQNRNAAVRYRSKKKGELQVLLEEEKELQTKNNEFHSKVNGLKKEVDYLKNLMLDVIKARLSKGKSKTNCSMFELLLQSNENL